MTGYLISHRDKIGCIDLQQRAAIFYQECVNNRERIIAGLDGIYMQQRLELRASMYYGVARELLGIEETDYDYG